jgi:hypothetical protein
MATCKFHPELYQKYTKKNGHRVLNPIYGKKICCRVCGYKIIIGQPHPEIKRRGNRYWLPQEPEPPDKLDSYGWQIIQNEFDTSGKIDNEILRMIIAARRPKKPEPMSTERHGQVILLPEGNLIGQVIYDIIRDGEVVTGYTWNENWEAMVIFVGANLWTLSEHYHKYAGG